MAFSDKNIAIVLNFMVNHVDACLSFNENRECFFFFVSHFIFYDKNFQIIFRFSLI